ncbi:MAG: hypothetical protein HY000_38260 [Planctomycetes bacterium]|nr:hypothetical protein [Planctomycetota bacterium]
MKGVTHLPIMHAGISQRGRMGAQAALVLPTVAPGSTVLHSAFWYPMDTSQHRLQLKYEADAVAVNDRAVGRDGIVPADERVEFIAPESVQLPRSRLKPASDAEHRALNSLLAELCDLNNQHVGERTREAEAFLVLSGLHHDLVASIELWCETYFARRADPSLINPKDGGDPFLKFLRLAAEYHELIGKLGVREHALFYVVLDECTAYCQQFLFSQTCMPHMFIARNWIELHWIPARRTVPHECVQFVSQSGLRAKSLVRLLGISAQLDHPRLDFLRTLSKEHLQSTARTLANDIQEMRPLLVRNFNPMKTITAVAPSLFIAWDWSLRYGIGNLYVERSQEDIIEAVHSGKCAFSIKAIASGLLVDGHQPWISVLKCDSAQFPDALAFNVLLLESIHDKLWSFYDQIDRDRIRRTLAGGQKAPAIEDANRVDEVSEDELLALACRDLAACTEPDLPSEPTPATLVERSRPRIPLLRFSQLIGVLRELDCEVEYGKGSEVTVYRPGGRKCLIAHHKRNPEIPSFKVKQLLSRLRVPVEDFVRRISR